MKEEVVRKIYEKVDNQWHFVNSAADKYDEEFKKTAKIGEPPKIEKIMGKLLDELYVEKESIKEEQKETETVKKEEK